MDRNRTGRNKKKTCGKYNNVVEPEYDVVDDQEKVLQVRILPARPINDDKEYADRDLPRSSSAQSLSSLSTGSANIPPRETSPITGPAINRDLKPGRRRTRLAQKHPTDSHVTDKRDIPVPPGEQRSYRRSPSPPVDLVNHLPGLTLRQPCQREKVEDASIVSSLHSETMTPSAVDKEHLNKQTSAHIPKVYRELKVFIPTKDTLWIWKLILQKQERVPSKRQHHEWPQTKEDFQQNDFAPVEKLQQTYCEEHWYVGACTRADAEHALHLVNKDGAFLVRDCSVITNSEPLVLAVYHEKKVYNVKIRFIESIGKYALGTGQRSNDMFDTVSDMIKFHSIFPILLISGRNMPGSKYPENCVLTYPVTKQDVYLLLHTG